MLDPAAEGYRRLACAVLVQAYRDSLNPDGHRVTRVAGSTFGVTSAEEARSFLQADGARWLVALLDLDPTLLDYALAKLPKTKKCETARTWTNRSFQTE